MHILFLILNRYVFWIVVFWVVTPCSLAGDGQSFGGTYCLRLQDRRFYMTTRLHGAIAENTTVRILNVYMFSKLL
jgi:hypothetical protein